MKNIKTAIMLSIIWCCLIVQYLYAEEPSRQDVRCIRGLSDTVSLEVVPRVELLAGVLSHTSWMDRMGPQGQGNVYFQALHNYFFPYRKHQAVQLAETLTQQGFDFDDPLVFLLHLSPLPDLSPIHAYPASLIQQAGGKETLEHFRIALRDLAEQSDFFTFFAQQQAELQAVLDAQMNSSDEILALTDRFSEFYGDSVDRFRVIFVPAMFRAGYGGYIESEHETQLWAVLGALDSAENEPEFGQEERVTDATEQIFYVAWCESLLNDGGGDELYSGLHALYEPVRPVVESSLTDFLCETLSRSIRTLYDERIKNDPHFLNNRLMRDFIQGYYLDNFTLEQLREYQSDRKTYPTFKAFLPHLLRQYEAHTKTLLSGIHYGSSQWKYEEKESPNSSNPDDFRIALQLAEWTSAEILPRMELLAGVLSQTSWMEMRGPIKEGNAYFQALQKFFTPYREHPAIQFAEALTQEGFSFSDPVRFLLHLSPLPDFAPIYSYTDDAALMQEAPGIHVLEYFRHALKDLAEQSNFQEFFEQHRSELTAILQEVILDFEAAPVVAWLNEFYGWSADEYHLVFTPAMFPGGGYGVPIETSEKFLVYQVIREQGRSLSTPEFPTGRIDLSSLSLHEFSHSFTNPSLRKYGRLARELPLRDFYMPVEEKMEHQAYGSLLHFFDETLVRSITAMALHDLFHDEKLYHETIVLDEKRGFYLNRFTIQQLEYYRKHRDLYPRFDEFLPHLLQQYVEHKHELLALLAADEKPLD